MEIARPSGAWRSKSATRTRVVDCLNCDRRLDGRVRLVALEGEVFVLELEQLAACGVEAHAREGARAAGELLARLLEVVEVQMRVAQREDELAGLEAGHLRDHQGEQ